MESGRRIVARPVPNDLKSFFASYSNKMAFFGYRNNTIKLHFLYRTNGITMDIFYQ